MIKPGYRWMGHKAGQYLRIGVDINGVRHWRAYSLTSDPYRSDGMISITVKSVDEGKVSSYLVRRGEPGTIVGLGGVEGDFVLPDPPPPKLLFISAGSGITPIMSMLRHLDGDDELKDAVLLHSARRTDLVIFGDELRELERRVEGFKLHLQLTGESGRMTPADLDQLCPGLAGARNVHLGPERHARCVRPPLRRVRRLRSAPHGALPAASLVSARPGRGEGGTIKFCKSKAEAESDGHKPILVAGEEAGLDLPYGCREGICHTCVGELRTGRVRDLRNGEVYGQEGEVIRTCISAPEGPIEIDLLTTSRGDR